jgi:2-acylglycerol O-acyltransferase 2
MARKLLNIEFVDFLHVPLHRRLQTLAVLFWNYSFLYQGVVCLFVFFILLFSPLFWVALAYGAWYVYDFKTPERGGRPFKQMRNASFWRYFRDYFPVSLHKTAELDPSRNYLMLYHPHGVIGLGAFINFGTTATGFLEKFPGIRSTLITLKCQFIFPFHREYIMSFGAVTASRQSIDYVLTEQGKGNAAVLVVGGASEALEARPGSFTLTLKRRKGFIRVALDHGVPLVPVFAFGENDLFNQVPNPTGSLLRRYQMFIMKTFTYSPPLIYGRGIFNYTIGFMPFRRPINVVVGSPMEVPKIPNATEEQLNKVHIQYLEQLSALFEAEKSKYGVPDDQHLTFI